MLRDANQRRRAQTQAAQPRAQIALLRAWLFAVHAANLVQQSRERLVEHPPTTLDAATVARLTEGELWRRRLANRFVERDLG